MPFHCSFNIELKLETTEADFCSLFLWNFFGYSGMTNSHIFCGNSLLRLIKSLAISLFFEITLVDTLHHFVKF